jgi:hypothetical protein
MTTEILKQITEITNELKNLHGDDYGEQFCNRALFLITNNSSYKSDYQIIFEAVHTLIDNDYKDRLIFNLQKKIKEQESRITKLEEENKELKNEIKVLKEDNKQKDCKINKLEKQVNVLMRNHYLIVIAQAYKNLEYYIIQKATGYDAVIMDSININLNDFLANANYQTYHEEVARLMKHFEIEKYSASLSKIKRARNNEAHPDPIDMDELKDACESLKTKYLGIERLYEGYQEVNNSQII